MTKPFHDTPDDVLVSMTLLGNQDAYEALVRRYQRSVLSSAWLILHNRYLAEDAAQDAFVTAWMKLNTLRDPARFGYWVCRIAANRAKNTAIRAREWMDSGDSEKFELLRARQDYSAWQTGQAEEESNQLIRQSLERLSEKVRMVIRMHYFEGLSVAEIASRLAVSPGTVKWRLHEGRETLRKELNMMNAQEMNAFVAQVMEKLEKLKLWGRRNDTKGFAEKYREVMADIEKIPAETHTEAKYRAMGETLITGFWWLPEEEKEERESLLARIRECLEKSRSEYVMEFLVWYDYDKLSGQAAIDCLTEKAAMLEKEGYVQSLGYALFWLGHEYIITEHREEAYACWNRVLEVLSPKDVYYANALAVLHTEPLVEKENLSGIQAQMCGETYMWEDGRLIFHLQPGYHRGSADSERMMDALTYYGSRCDNVLLDLSMKPGDTITASDGKITLTFEADDVTVETPCGTFAGCQCWFTDGGWKPVRTYYKAGVGIVKQTSGINTALLTAYTVQGGEGLWPFAPGNRWEYETVTLPETASERRIYEITWTDGKNATLWQTGMFRRDGYGDCWEDRMKQVQAEYLVETNPDTGEGRLADVTEALDKAAEFASTPFEKAMTAAAKTVFDEMWASEPDVHPGCERMGHWNFFNASAWICEENGVTIPEYGSRGYGFEAKNTPVPAWLVFSDLFVLLRAGAGCIWSDKWQDGYKESVQQTFYDYHVTTDLRAEAVGQITTPAGTFADCLRVHLDVAGFGGGHDHFGGKKAYDFAPGVGLIRSLHWFRQDETEKCAVYSLTGYTGTGEGYMPMAEGMRRTFALTDAPEDMIARCEYAWEKDQNGRLTLIEGRIGSRIRTAEERAKDLAER